MSTKRTFGLVGDYGETDSEEEEEEEKRVKTESVPEEEQEEEVKEGRVRSVWDGVRKEYEDSSLMYKFVTEGEEGTNVGVCPGGGTLSEEARQTLYKEALEASLQNVHQRRTAEEQVLELEIRAIQSDIQEQRKRMIEIVLYVYAKPAASSRTESFAIFKEDLEKVRDIEALVDMKFGDFEAALSEKRRCPAVVRLRTKPWVAKKLRGKFEGSSREKLFDRVREVEGGRVDIVNAQHGGEVPRVFAELGLSMQSV